MHVNSWSQTCTLVHNIIIIIIIIIIISYLHCSLSAWRRRIQARAVAGACQSSLVLGSQSFSISGACVVANTLTWLVRSRQSNVLINRRGNASPAWSCNQLRGAVVDPRMGRPGGTPHWPKVGSGQFASDMGRASIEIVNFWPLLYIGTCPLNFQQFNFLRLFQSHTNSDIRLHLVAYPLKQYTGL